MDSICSILIVFLIAYSTHVSNGIHKVGKHLFIAELGDITFQRAPDVCRNRTHSIVASLDDDDIGILLNGSRNNTSDTERESKFMWIKDAHNISALGHGCGTNRCRHGGMCIVNDNTEVCLCEKGYTGNFCQYKNCLIRPCKNNGSCENTTDGYMCNCMDNYHGQWCEIEGCTSGRCLNDGSCTFINGNVKCDCKNLYFGRFCELNYTSNLKYIGCLKNNRDRILDNANFYNRDTNTPNECARQCASVGKRYIGLEHSEQCFCGNQLHQNIPVPKKQCSKKCDGNSTIYCGGWWKSSVYEITHLQYIVNKSIVDCRFRENDDCFIEKNSYYRNDWQRKYNDKEYDAGFIEFRSSQQLDKGIYTLLLTVNGPKCLRFTYKKTEGTLKVYQLSDDNGYDNKMILFSDLDTENEWLTKSKQLHDDIFSTIVFEASSSKAAVKINDIEIQPGYCSCSESNCLQGKQCYESMHGSCCKVPKDCLEKKETSFHNGSIRCTFRERIPCFVSIKGDSWEHINDTGSSGIRLSNKKRNITSGHLESIYLPSYSLYCLTLKFEQSIGSEIYVVLTDENDTVSSVLLDTTLSTKINNTTQIDMFTTDNLKIQIKATLHPNTSSWIIFREIILEGNYCLNDVTQCDSLFVRDFGNVTMVLPVGLNVCQWSVQVEEGHKIEIEIYDDMSENRHNETYWQIYSEQDELIPKSLGGRLTLPYNFVTVRYFKSVEQKVNIALTWRKVVAYCSALYTTEDQVYLINISCNEKLMSVACQQIPETTAQTNTETTSPQAFVITERNKQTDNGLQLILAICIPVIIVISLLVVIIAVKRLRNKTSKDKESEEVIYVNESSSVPLDRKYEGFQIDDQYSETLPNEENPYSNASDTEEQGEPADMSQTVMEYNEEYDHLAFDGTKKNVGQKSSVDSETDNSYGTLHGNRVGEDQQDVYDLAESSHTKTLDITGAEYATSSKVRGIRDGGDEYSTPNKVREIKNVSAEYSTPEKVRGISNGGFVRDNADNTRLYSTDDVTDNTYDHAT